MTIQDFSEELAPEITWAQVVDALEAGLSVELPIGVWEANTAVTPATGAHLKGQGRKTRIIVTGADTNLFHLNGVQDCVFKDFYVEHTGNDHGYTFYVDGASSHISIRDVQALNPFALVKTTGTSSSRNTSIDVRDCYAKSTTGTIAQASQYGYIFEWTDDISIRDCRASGFRLDGLKFGGDNSGIRVLGGRFFDNGYFSGDGIDAYTGGENLTIVGTVCDGNGLNSTGIDGDDSETGGAGIQIKTGPLSGTSGRSYPHNVQLIGVQCRNNADHGLILNRSDPSTTSQGWVSGVSIVGGIFEGNGQQGIYLRGRMISVHGAVCRANGTDGIQVSTFCQEVVISACLLMGNGTNTSSDTGIEINADSCTVTGCIFNGKDVVSAGDATAVAAGTQKARYGIRITSAVPGGNGGTNIVVTDCVYANHSTADILDQRV